MDTPGIHPEAAGVESQFSRKWIKERRKSRTVLPMLQPLAMCAIQILNCS